VILRSICPEVIGLGSAWLLGWDTLIDWAGYRQCLELRSVHELLAVNARKMALYSLDALFMKLHSFDLC